MLNEIIIKLQEKGYSAEVTTTIKNGVKKTGIIIGTGNIRPIFYVDGFMKSGMNAEAAVKEIVNLYEKEAYDLQPKFDLDAIKTWDYAKNHLQLCIQNRGTEDIVKKSFLDMELYVRVNVGSNGSYKVSSVVLQMFGVSEEELFKTAFNLTKASIKVEDMADIVNVMNECGEILVLSNTERIFGASAICYTDVLSAIADSHESDLVILPSSIHECLVYPVKDPDMAMFTAMVKEVNETQVIPEEVLSNHAYFFNRETGKIEY